MNVRMVGEDEKSFSMHDGKSTFKVAKAGLSDEMQGKIRAMSDGLARGGRISDVSRKVSPAPRRAPSVEVTALEPTRLDRGTEQYGGPIGPERPSRLTDGQKHPDFNDDEFIVERAYGGPIPEGLPDRMGSGPMVYDARGLPVPFVPGSAIANAEARPEILPVQLNTPPPVSPVPLGMSAEERPVVPGQANPYADYGSRAGASAASQADSGKQMFDDRGNVIIRNRGADEGYGLGEKGRALGIKPRSDVEMVAAPTGAPQAAAASPRVGGTAQPLPGMNDMRGGIEVQKGANVMAANAKAEEGRQTAEQLGAVQMQLEANEAQRIARENEANQRAADVMSQFKSAQDEMKNISTTVDPGRFWASRSTGGKIAGIIGLALGSLSPDGINRAQQQLNQAIDRDLDAQKAEHSLRLQKGQASLNAAQSAYAMEHQRFGDEAAASAAAKANLLALSQNKLQQIAAGSTNPQVAAQAQQLNGALDVQRGSLEEKAANDMANRAHLYATAAATRAAVSGKTGLDPKSKDLLMEVESRNRSIQQNGNKLLALIDSYGTQEKLTPGVEGQMRQLATDMAVDAAKLKDPNSVVRPSEMESEIANIFSPGFMQRSSAAKAQIKAMMQNSDARRKVSYDARGQ